MLRCAACLVACAATGLQTAMAGGQTRLPTLFTQRDINALAAPLAVAHYRLLSGQPPRLARESVGLYLHRLAQKQAGETPNAYQARIAGYLQTFQQAARITAPGRTIPAPLRDDSPANRQRWQAIARALSPLPRRVEKTRRAGLLAQNDARFRAALGDEMTQTLGLILAAEENLRDALP